MLLRIEIYVCVCGPFVGTWQLHHLDSPHYAARIFLSIILCCFLSKYLHKFKSATYYIAKVYRIVYALPCDKTYLFGFVRSLKKCCLLIKLNVYCICQIAALGAPQLEVMRMPNQFNLVLFWAALSTTVAVDCKHLQFKAEDFGRQEPVVFVYNTFTQIGIYSTFWHYLFILFCFVGLFMLEVLKSAALLFRFVIISIAWIIAHLKYGLRLRNQWKGSR